MNASLRYFVKRILILSVFLPVVWFVFICVWGTILETRYQKNLIYPYGGLGYLNLRLQQADTTRDLELLVLGSSHAYRGIDPRILQRHGIEAFNLGSSLQTPVQTEYLLKKYLHRMNPRVVIFEVGFKTFSSDGVESAVDVLSNVDRFDRDLLEMVFAVNEVTVYNSLAYAFFRKKILGLENAAFADEDERYIAGGFVENLDSDYEGPEQFTTSPRPIEDKQKRAFESCLAYLEANNVKVILIQAPILHDYYLSIENKQEYDVYFMEKASTYFNFSDSAYTDKTLFYDHHHLNHKGVLKFNEALIELIHPHVDKLTVKDSKIN